MIKPQVQTGLYAASKNVLGPRSQRIRYLVRLLRKRMPWLEESDLPACRAWAELEILGAIVFTELASNGPLTPEREGRRLLDDYRRMRSTQLLYEKELGMTPAARMAIKASGTRAAFDLAAAMVRTADEGSDGDNGPTGASGDD
jgi:hypothetical protein